MTTRWLDSFDLIGNSTSPNMLQGQYDTAYDVQIDSTHVRTGVSDCHFAGLGGYLVKLVPSSAKYWMGSAAYVTAFVQYEWNMVMGTGYTSGFPVKDSTAGQGIRAYCSDGLGNITVSQFNGSTNTVLYTTTNAPITGNAFDYFELVCDGSGGAGAGTVAVWKNGITQLFVISGLTLPAFDYVSWGGLDHSWIDDIYADDATQLGAQQCFSLFVNSDQTPQNWSLSSGTSAFALIDAAPYNTANYISGANVGDISRFTVDSLTAPYGRINSMRICGVMALAAAGSAGVQMHGYIGANTYNGAINAPSTSQVYYSDMYDLTGITVAEINTMQIDVEKTA